MEKTKLPPTEAQPPPVDLLLEFEAAARLILQSEGQDPEERVALPRVAGQAQGQWTFRWRIEAAALRRHHIRNGVLYGAMVEGMQAAGDEFVKGLDKGGGADGAAIAGVGQ